MNEGGWAGEAKSLARHVACSQRAGVRRPGRCDAVRPVAAPVGGRAALDHALEEGTE